jgi:hypothetical protein
MLNPKECREVWLQVGEELRTRVLVSHSSFHPDPVKRTELADVLDVVAVVLRM